MPRRLKELHLRIGAASAELAQHLGRAPTPTELAHELGTSRTEVAEGLIAGNSYNALSIDGTSSSQDEDTPALSDTLGFADNTMELVESRETLRPLLNSLPNRERTVLMLRFFESMTQSQIAERIGVSQMHVSRLLTISLAKLRDQLQ